MNVSGKSLLPSSGFCFDYGSIDVGHALQRAGDNYSVQKSLMFSAGYELQLKVTLCYFNTEILSTIQSRSEQMGWRLRKEQNIYVGKLHLFPFDVRGKMTTYYIFILKINSATRMEFDHMKGKF
jgi:hypothetical protein